MTIKTANDTVPGVRTFRCVSDSRPDTIYTVKRLRRPPSVRGPVIRNRWLCTCGDFMNRRMLDNTHCKHIRRIRSYAATVGGVSRIPKGQTIIVPDTVAIPKTLVFPKKKG
jgi:hypothetical protein